MVCKTKNIQWFGILQLVDDDGSLQQSCWISQNTQTWDHIFVPFWYLMWTLIQTLELFLHGIALLGKLAEWISAWMSRWTGVPVKVVGAVMCGFALQMATVLQCVRSFTWNPSRKEGQSECFTFAAGQSTGDWNHKRTTTKKHTHTCLH